MDILFWSGGKDSYLALEFYKKEYGLKNIKLLTTYGEQSDIVPHQNIPLKTIEKQAEMLTLELIKIGLPEKCPNETYLKKLDDAMDSQKASIAHLVFGDWHLEDIRKWREQSFKNLGYRCLFPIWQKSIHDLLPVLILKDVEVKVSAVSKECEPYIRIGELYNQKFVQQLPRDIDPMGENGEFHTVVEFKDWRKANPKHE